MIKVVTIAGHSYYPGVAVTLASLVKFASHPEEIEFHVLTDDLTEEDCTRLTALGRKFGLTSPVVADRPDMAEIRATCPDYKGSPLTWLSIFLPSYFPDDDWIVYCDSDILWGRDVCELWNFRDEEVGVFWCRDMQLTQKAQSACQCAWNPDFQVDKYCCNAVSLVNLKKLRQMRFVERAKQFIATYGCPYYCDQDIENHLMNDSSRILDQTWNCMTPSRGARSGANIHCLGIAHQFKRRKMQGWNARNALWFDFYNACVADGGGSMESASFLKRLWFRILGWTYPVGFPYRFLALLVPPHRREKLRDFHFFAWLYAHR